MRTRIILQAAGAAALAASLPLFTGCGQGDRTEDRNATVEERVDGTLARAEDRLNDDREAAVRSLAEAKRAIAQDLRRLRVDIDERIARIEDRMDEENLGSPERKALRERRAELYKQRSRIEKSLDDVMDAGTDTWAETEQALRQNTTAVGDWLRTEKEKFDHMTKGDADKDGH